MECSFFFILKTLCYLVLDRWYYVIAIFHTRTWILVFLAPKTVCNETVQNGIIIYTMEMYMLYVNENPYTRYKSHRRIVFVICNNLSLQRKWRKFGITWVLKHAYCFNPKYACVKDVQFNWNLLSFFIEISISLRGAILRNNFRFLKRLFLQNSLVWNFVHTFHFSTTRIRVL